MLKTTPKIFTKKNFVTWLKEHKNNVVGHVGRCYTCPIANWLNTYPVFQDQNVWVGSDVIYSNIKDFPLPQWGQSFVLTVDRAYNDVVTGDNCLEILGVKA